MSSGPITECPACGTRFRVGESQLEAAGGQVRCGACLGVFQARDHFVIEIYEDQHIVDMSNAPTLEGTLSEEFLALEARQRAVREQRVEEDAPGEAEELDEEERLLRERTTAEHRRTSVLGTEKTEEKEKEGEHQAREGEAEQEQRAKIPNLANFGFTSGTMEHTPSPRRTWIYAAASSLLLVVFVIQILYSQADSLSHDSRLRPFYQQFCAVFGCTLAEVREPDRIRSRQVVVQSHPDAQDAIMVDAVIYNDAPYAQAFPWIELQFSDMNGRPVASRRFAPQEYLSGELEERNEMPPKTPIRVSLSLVDPGRDAVNYMMLFY